MASPFGALGWVEEEDPQVAVQRAAEVAAKRQRQAVRPSFAGADGLIGKRVRENLYPSEQSFFSLSPNVAGMASESGDVVLNPYADAGVNPDAVARNEAFRLHLRERKLRPDFAVTKEQRSKFVGTPYENDDAALRETIAARIYSGDPSALATDEQRQWVDRLTKTGRRREGATTRVLDSLGTSLYDAAARPARIWGALNTMQPGEALSDRPDIVDAGIATSLDLIGLPGIMGAVPKGAVGSAARGLRPFEGPPDEALMAIHNTRTERLAKADELGGLAVPSVAITKPSQGFGSFGDISLVAPPEFVKPGRGNPVFASDVYSPRFPSLNDEGTKIFRGFTDMGNRRYAPLTLDNLVREMKGNVRGGEGGIGFYGAGAVRSSVTPQFGSLREIQDARGRIIPDKDFSKLKEGTNDRLADLAAEFEPFYKYSGRGFQHMNDFASMLAEYARMGLRPMAEHYPGAPAELMDKARGFLNDLRTMPTEYFEAKPQRAVRIGEFGGAVVPDREMAAVAPILEKHGIKRIEQYPAGDQGTAQRDALMKFPEYFFSNKPDARAAALIAASGERPFGSLAPTEVAAPSGIRAYHGSPHDFDRFDISKIGTGEGAQAYGHGLYFAENEGVARSYRDMLAGLPATDSGDLFSSLPWAGRNAQKWGREALDTAIKSGASGDDAIRMAIGDLSRRGDMASASHVRQPYYDAANALGGLLGKDWRVNPGRMYEVDIRAKPEQMLDWDSPVLAQGEAFKPFAEEAAYQIGKPAEALTVGETIPVLGNRRAPTWGASGFGRGHAALSNELKQSGYPGIRYLDQGSRGRSASMLDPQIDAYRKRLDTDRGMSARERGEIQGKLDDMLAERARVQKKSSNYVLFDDSLIDILRKYAIPGAAGGAGFGSLAPGDE